MNKNQEEYFLCAFIWNLKMEQATYAKRFEEEVEQIHEFEKIKCQYPHLEEVIKVIEDTLHIWKGKIEFYDKAIGYLEDIIKEKGLINILNRGRNETGNKTKKN